MLRQACAFIARDCAPDAISVQTMEQCASAGSAPQSLVLFARDAEELARCATGQDPALDRVKMLSSAGLTWHFALPAINATLANLSAAAREAAKAGAHSITFVVSCMPQNESIGHFDFWAHRTDAFSALTEAKNEVLQGGAKLCRFSFLTPSGLEHFEFRGPDAFSFIAAEHQIPSPPWVVVTKPQVFCNYNCGFCSFRKDTYRENIKKMTLGPINERVPQLTPEDWMELVSEAADLGAKEIIWSGGEILLYKRFDDLLKGISKEPRVHHCIDTNGSRLSKDILRDMVRSGLRELHFSLDSADPTTHDKIRGFSGAYDMVIAGLRWCTELLLEGEAIESANLNTVVTRQGYTSFPELLKLDEEFPIVTYHSFSFLEGAYGYLDHRLTEEDLAHFREHVRPLMLQFLARRPFSHEKYRQKAMANCTRMFTNEAASDAQYAQGIYWKDAAMVRMFCRIPSYFALVVQNGDVLPCTGIEEFKEPIVGNVKKQPFAKIWNSAEYERFRHEGDAKCQLCPLHHNVNITYGLEAWAHQIIRDRISATPPALASE